MDLKYNKAHSKGKLLTLLFLWIFLNAVSWVIHSIFVQTPAWQEIAYGHSSIIYPLIGLSIGILQFIAFYGLWNMKKWSVFLYLPLAFFTTILYQFFLYKNTVGAPLNIWLSMGASLVFWVFVFRRKWQLFD